MPNFVNIVKAYKANGLTCIPVDENKQPLVNWAFYQEKPMSDKEIEKYFSDTFGFAVLTGGKGGLELLDIDSKYFLDPDMYEKFKKSIPNNILKKLWVQTSMNGGYHFIYKCSVVEPNQKLAMRPTTREERHAVYMEAYEAGEDMDTVINSAKQHKSVVLFETRGGTSSKCGGYFLCAPTKGYKKIYGKLHEITPEEREIILESARSFNSYIELKKDYKLARINHDHKANDSVSPFEKFNEEGDGLKLLIEHGWKPVNEKALNSGKDVRLKRPGVVHSKSSGLYDRDSKLFNCFSTSTSFEANKAYTPANLFIELECNGDTQLAYQKLKEMGY